MGRAQNLAVEQRLMLFRGLQNQRLAGQGRQLSKSAVRRWWRSMGPDAQAQVWDEIEDELVAAGMLAGPARYVPLDMPMGASDKATQRQAIESFLRRQAGQPLIHEPSLVDPALR